MDSFIVQILIGLVIGTLGTLIGAGGGFLLVPLLLLTHPYMQPEIVTAISIAVVAVNALSGSVAYARSVQIDYRAGLLFAVFTLPGSIIGVGLTSYIPRQAFNGVFGSLLLLFSTYLLKKINLALPQKTKVCNLKSGTICTLSMTRQDILTPISTTM